MNLYLLRHGEAEAAASSPEGRQLTRAGEDEVINVARQFSSRNLMLDCCYVSPALRARQTAEAFLSQAFNPPDAVITGQLNAEQRAADLMKFLESVTAGNILLVSHNPLLSELLALLVRGNLDNLHILDTGNLACVTLDIVGLGMGSCPCIFLPDFSLITVS